MTPSPRNIEELACMKKIEELRRYTDMIQRMIVKIGNEGVVGRVYYAKLGKCEMSIF